ncbi:type VI secretion system Vgr family protein [Flavobacterium sp. '19STA2R22 D10 B1']|uniref:type VI secretion system Vgr family protein n=1 Tax=Flavobacterium aerium TaxID=3037261 RepID=UPI00278BCC53|nr:phage baseplate assembly protein V [Flavobacterium sp. '19STA2R22 D10 B1']
MPISTTVQIRISGEVLPRFSQLVINQKVNTHHQFSLLQPLPKEFITQAMDKAQSYIGQPINIKISPSNMLTESPLIFNGIITEAQMVRTSGSSGGIIINGYSPTILMEGTPHAKSYTEQTLSEIVNEILKSYSQENIKPSVSIQRDTTLPYTVQYNESDFGFLCRMAQKKGEWLYYNGEELRFGSPKPKTFTLEYGRILHSFNIEMRAKAMNFQYLGYESSSADNQKATAAEVNYQTQGVSQAMVEVSKKMFPNQSTMLYSNSIEEGNSRAHLVDRLKTQLQSRASDLVTARGDSDETGLRIGDIVVIREPAFSITSNPLDSLQEQFFGSYYITDITHVCDESGNYHNTFDAVPDTVASPPYGNVHSTPQAETQPAVVVDNNDPKGLGRVQVEFPWQKGLGSVTPWIRMTNPHTGGGKGFYFIPEVGEEVLVAFEAGNAEKPFVLGAMYNGSEYSGYADSQNKLKVIQTRSGTKVIMNDDEGSITVEDPSGNTWFMDGNGNIVVNAPKNVTIEAGESIIMNAGSNIVASAKMDVNIVAGENITEMANDDYSLTASNITETAARSRTSNAKNINENMHEGQVVSTLKDIFIESATQVNVNSGKKVKMQ